MRKEPEIERRGSRSRDALRVAATALLDDRDASRISITDIVNAAGVTRPTFYQAFDDVSELFTAAAVGRLEEAFAQIDDATLPSGDPMSQMGAAFDVVLNALVEHEQFFLRLLRGPAGHKVTSAMTDAVSVRLAAGSPVAALLEGRSLPSDKARSALAAGAVWLIVDWLNSSPAERPPTEAVAARARDFVYFSVIGGLADIPPACSSASGVPLDSEPVL
jgi:AcrR family transcriptional regulator